MNWPTSTAVRRDDVAAVGDLAARVADDEQRPQRQQEDQRQVHVVQGLAEHVAREPEEVAAGDGRVPVARELAAEQERRERRERGRGEREQVVDHDRPERRRERHHQQRRPRDHGGPREVEALGGVDVVREERVDALRHDHLPVDQGPHEEALVGAERPDHGPLRVGQGREAEEGDRAARSTAPARRPCPTACPGSARAGRVRGAARRGRQKRSGRPEWTARSRYLAAYS